MQTSPAMGFGFTAEHRYATMGPRYATATLEWKKVRQPSMPLNFCVLYNSNIWLICENTVKREHQYRQIKRLRQVFYPHSLKLHTWFDFGTNPWCVPLKYLKQTNRRLTDSRLTVNRRLPDRRSHQSVVIDMSGFSVLWARTIWHKGVSCGDHEGQKLGLCLLPNYS